MTTATQESQATVEISWDLLSTLSTLASYANERHGSFEAHEIRDALALLHDDLDEIEVATVEAWGGDLERRTAQANEMVRELMREAGHA